MKIYITSAYEDHIAPEWLWQYNTNSSLKRVDNPELADLIIFAEGHPDLDPYFRQVHRHQLIKKFPDKCVLYHDADRSITYLRTISPSIEKWQYNPLTCKSGHYIARLCENDAINNTTPLINEERQYLFNFIGGRTYSIRDKILSLNYPKSFVKDTTGIHAWKLDSEDKNRYEKEYLQIMNDSYFVLCPRGFGPSSYRLFETMQLARVPVIISDEWIPPVFDFDWNDIAIIIDEDKVEQIPSILESKQIDAVNMGRKSREVWEKYFSPEASLTTLVSAANDLIKEPMRELHVWKNNLLFIRDPWHLKNYLRYRKNSIKQRFFRSNYKASLHN